MITTAQRLTVPDAELYYEVRGSGPLVVLVGAPMDADSFAPLAEELATDHTVLTTDPRGIHRSRLIGQGSTPEQRADDLARLIRYADAGPAAVFGSSGGAVTALALAQAHPELVTTVIAHEPPLDRLVEDGDELLAASERMIADYLAGDVTGAWRQFFALANIEVPDGVVEAMFGGERDPRVVADERFWFEHELRESVSWLPELARLKDSGVRIVVGIGEESGGQLCDRTSTALAAGLGIEPTRFPGDHTGFVSGAAPFAAVLRASWARPRARSCDR
ncbi:alpha/beta fold hydrolase [Kribbella swartbergensis]